MCFFHFCCELSHGSIHFLNLPHSLLLDGLERFKSPQEDWVSIAGECRYREGAVYLFVLLEEVVWEAGQTETGLGGAASA